jgi:hypothetical protein
MNNGNVNMNIRNKVLIDININGHCGEKNDINIVATLSLID